MIVGLIDEAVVSGARLFMACSLLGLSKRTVQRWRNSKNTGDLRAGPTTTPANKLSPAERAEVIKVINQPEYRDLSPKQIVPQLADKNTYVASESTMYRILREEKALEHRSNAKPSTKRQRPDEYAPTGPRQVMSWDITYLPTTVRGLFFYLYMVMDIWSRKIVAWAVHESESAELSSALISKLADGLEGTAAVLHSDNGGPMKGATMLATLERLGIAASFSRPRVSNDNPYSESLFGTLKSRPGYPERRFDDVGQACEWLTPFVSWYNNEHLHSAIGFVTPANRHDGVDKDILEARRNVYAHAKAKNPSRWSRHHRQWERPKIVRLNPKLTTLNR